MALVAIIQRHGQDVEIGVVRYVAPYVRRKNLSQWECYGQPEKIAQIRYHLASQLPRSNA